MNLRVLAAAALVCLFFGCSSNNNNNSGPAPLNGVDALNAFNILSQATATGQSAISSSLAHTSSCVTENAINPTDNDKDGIPVDVIYNFNCPGVTGSAEIRDLNDNDPNSPYQVSLSNFITSNASTCTSSNSNGTLTIQKGVSGSWSFNMAFDEAANVNQVAYEIKGSLNETTTPDDPNNPQNGTSVTLSGAFDFIKGGTDMGQFSVSTAGLHFSSCGMDRGTLGITGPGYNFVATVVSCGSVTMTENGVPVTAPPAPQCQ